MVFVQRCRSGRHDDLEVEVLMESNILLVDDNPGMIQLMGPHPLRARPAAVRHQRRGSAAAVARHTAGPRPARRRDAGPQRLPMIGATHFKRQALHSRLRAQLGLGRADDQARIELRIRWCSSTPSIVIAASSKTGLLRLQSPRGGWTRRCQSSRRCDAASVHHAV